MVIKWWNPENESTEYFDNITRLTVMRTENKDKKEVVRELIFYREKADLPTSITDVLNLKDDEGVMFSPIWIMSDIGKTIERIN